MLSIRQSLSTPRRPRCANFLLTNTKQERASTYFEFLHPSEVALQRIWNRRVRQLLEKDGDNADKERKIDHLVLLPNPAARSTFIDYVRRENFEVDFAPDAANAEAQFSVEFSRLDRPSSIDEVVDPVVQKVLELGGVYDGWGCEVTP